MKAARNLAVAVALASGATAAIADPLTQLFFSQDSGWLDPEVAFNGDGTLSFSGPTGAEAPDDTFTTLTWDGSDGFSGESSITITNYTSDTTPAAQRFQPDFMTADADGEWNEGDIWAIDQLLQTNEVISGGRFPNPLWTVQTLANLRIFSDSVGGNEIFADLDSDTTVSLWETPNTNECGGSPSPLYDNDLVPDETPTGSDSCDDIFTVPLTDFAPVSFAFDGFIYSLNFTIINGVARDDDGNIIGPTLACSLADPAPSPLCAGDGVTPDDGSFAVYTPEYSPGSTDLYVGAFWTVSPVPAPAALGLMGIGLVSLGLAGRRRKK